MNKINESPTLYVQPFALQIFSNALKTIDSYKKSLLI